MLDAVLYRLRAVQFWYHYLYLYPEFGGISRRTQQGDKEVYGTLGQ